MSASPDEPLQRTSKGRASIKRGSFRRRCSALPAATVAALAGGGAPVR